jgi:hypothetical protein
MLGCGMVERVRSLGMIEVFSELDLLIAALKTVRIVLGIELERGWGMPRRYPAATRIMTSALGFGSERVYCSPLVGLIT